MEFHILFIAILLLLSGFFCLNYYDKKNISNGDNLNLVSGSALSDNSIKNKHDKINIRDDNLEIY